MSLLDEIIEEDKKPETPVGGVPIDTTIGVTPVGNILERLISKSAEENRFTMVTDFQKEVTAKQASDVLKIKEKTGLPSEFINNNYAELSQEYSKPEFNVAEFYKNNPKTAEWLTDNPEYIPLFREFSPKHSWLESLGNIGKGLVTGTGSLIKSIGSQQVLSTVEDVQKEPAFSGDVSELGRNVFRLPTMAKRYFYPDKEESKYIKPLGSRTYLVDSKGNIVHREPIKDEPEEHKALREQHLGLVSDKIKNELSTSFGRKIYSLGKEIEGAFGDTYQQKKGFLSRFEEYPIETILTEGASQLPNLAAVVGSSLLLRRVGINPYVGAFTTSFALERGGIVSEGIEYLEQQYKGMENIPTEKIQLLTKVSNLYGSINGALDAVVPGSMISRKVVATKMIRRLLSKEGLKLASKEGLKDIAREVITEGIQENMSMDAQETITGKKIPIEQRIERTIQSMVGAGVVTGPISIASTKSQIASMQNAVNAKAIFEAINDNAQKDEILKTAPEGVKQFVDQQTKAGNVENTFIDVNKWDEFYQSQNIDPREHARDITGSYEQYDAAKASNLPLMVKLSQYITGIANKGEGAAFINDIKFRENDLTINEANEIKVILDKEQKDQEQKDIAQVTLEEIRNGVVDQLVKAGYSKEEAEINTKLHGLAGLIERGGADVAELIKKRYDDLIIKSGAIPKVKADKTIGSFDIEVTVKNKKGQLVKKKVKAKALIEKINKNIEKESAQLAKIENKESNEANQIREKISSLKEEKSNIIEKARKEGVAFDEDTLIQSGDEAPRAAFRRSMDKKYIIELFSGRDLSSFIHESAHMFLEIFSDVVDIINAKKEKTAGELSILDDYAKLLKWLRIDSRENITVEKHEQFARGFEAYVGEGKSPSTDLISVFSRFRAWIAFVYKIAKRFKLTGDKEISQALDVNLSNEVRGVLDRLVATETSIENMITELSLDGLITKPEDYGMNEDEFKLYIKTLEKANNAAKEKIQVQMINEFDRQNKKLWIEKAKEIKNEVEQEYYDKPVYKALFALQKGTNPDGTPLVKELEGIKLDMKELVDTFGQDIIDKLPKGITAKENGISIKEAIEIFGYESSSKMILELTEVQDIRKEIDEHVELLMKDEYGDLLLHGDLDQVSIDAVMENHRDKVIEMEMKALQKKHNEVSKFVKAEKIKQKKETARGIITINSPIPSAAILKAMAEGRIYQLKNTNIKPNQYLIEQKNHAKRAIDAAARNNFYEAFHEKYMQRLKIAMYLAANKALENNQRVLDFVHFLEKTETQKKIGIGGPKFLEQINAIIDSYEFIKVSAKNLNLRDQLSQFVDYLTKEGIPHAIPQSMIDDAKQVNYKTLTHGELMAVYDSLKSIYTIAIEANKIRIGNEKHDLDIKAGEVAELIINNLTDKYKHNPNSPLVKLGENISDFAATFTQVDTYLEEIDGFVPMGNAYMALKHNIDRAYAEKYIPRIDEEATNLMTITDILKGIKLSRDIYLKTIDKSITGEQALSIVLNMGNSGNYTALLESKLLGVNITEDVLTEIKDNLSEQEIQFVVSIWRYLETFRPEIKETYERRTGVSPEFVEGIPFVTKYGIFDGGYYPLKTDSLTSIKGYSHDIEEIFDNMKSGLFAAAMTKHGFAINRVGFGGKNINFSLSVIANHINEVVYDLSLGDSIRDTGKVLNHKKVVKAFEDIGQVKLWKTFDLWLRDVAIGELYSTDIVSRVFRYTRTGLIISTLGYSLSTASLQFTGIGQSMVVVGKKYIFLGMKDLISSHWIGDNSIFDQVQKMSPFMNHRKTTMNQDMMYVNNKLRGGRSKTMMFVRQTFLWTMVKAQQFIDMITWLGGYRRGMNEFKGNHKKAIEMADRLVQLSQGSGMLKDRSAMERGTLDRTMKQFELYKSLTVLAGYMIRKFNILRNIYKRTDFTSPSEVVAFIGNISLALAFEAIIVAIMKGKFKDDEDWVDAAMTATKETSLSLIGTIPVVRDAAALAQGYSPRNSIVEASARTWGMISSAYKNGLDKQTLKKTIAAAGILFHIPSVQINRIVDYLHDLESGYDPSLLKVIFGGEH